jgi:acid phosphatase
VNGAVSYNVQYRVNGGSSWTSTTATSNSKNISGLASGTTYEFQIQTVCSGNTSSWSASANFTTAIPCLTPTGLNTSSITESSAIANWNTAAGAVSYSIQYRKTGTSNWSSTSSSTISKSLTNLLPATNYEWQVMTNCSNGNSSWSSSSNFTTANSSTLPVPDHIVVLIEENHAYSQIIGSASAPWINALANDPMSALFTQMYGVEHPSQPNYLDLFSGTNQGMTNNNVPSAHFTTPNLARELLNAGKTFITYSQNLPSVGYDGASSGKYMRKHNPVTNWMGTGTNQVPSTLNQPFSAFPSDYSTLPTVSFVVPDQDFDMHDGTIATGDTWFHNNLDGYVQWAKTHNSLFILIFDEDDGNFSNRIAMIFTGPMVKSGTISTTYNHYNVLRSIEDMYGTTHAGNAATASPIHGCWVNGYKQSDGVKLAGSGFRWEVFPNPASTVINISYEMEDALDPSVTVYDNLGQKMSTFFLPETGNGQHQVSFSTSALRMN